MNNGNARGGDERPVGRIGRINYFDWPVFGGIKLSREDNNHMRSALCITIAFATIIGAQSAHGQAQDGAFELELNRLTEAQNGCRVTFVARNKLGARLDKTAIEIAVYDEQGIVSSKVVFDFGRLPNGRTKVVEYDLPRKCSTISQLQFNDVKECAGEKDLKQDCYDKIKTSTKTAVRFEQ
jgi:hypothetical protein